MMNMMMDIEKRDIMLDNALKLNPEYAEQQEQLNQTFEALKNISDDEEYNSLVFKFESVATYIQTIAQDLCYERGFQDGVKFLFECLSKDVESK